MDDSTHPLHRSSAGGPERIIYHKHTLLGATTVIKIKKKSDRVLDIDCKQYERINKRDSSIDHACLDNRRNVSRDEGHHHIFPRDFLRNFHYE